MGEIALAIGGLIAVGISVYWRYQAKAAESELLVVKAHCTEWYEKYVALVKDVRKQANQPKAVTPEAPANPLIKASSAAQIRRQFQKINAEALNSQD